MDILLPSRRLSSPTPVVLWIHGGGWDHGDKNSHLGPAFLVSAGFVVATLSYRLSDNSPFPAAIEDSKCAIRFLRANAPLYGLDGDHIGVAGSSAGGHLAQLVATADEHARLEGSGGWDNVSSKVQAVVSYFGPSDLAARFPDATVPVIVKFLRATEKEKPELYRMASPISYVSKNDPPLLLVHGEQDEGVPFDQSVRMAEAYGRAGSPVQFIAMQNTGHDFEHIGDLPISPSVDAIHERTIEFFERYLVPAGSIATMKAIDDDRNTVAALDKAYQAAVKNNDATTMARILADDFVLVTGSGKTYSKADMLEDARRGDDYEHNEEESQTVRIWGDTAVVTAKLWEKYTSEGKTYDRKSWFSDTYVRTRAGWKYVFGQSSTPPCPNPSQ